MHPIDPQTIHELQILPKHPRDESILNFFDHSATEGGRDKLKEMLLESKRSLPEILDCQELLKAIIGQPDAFTIDIQRTYVAAAEAYYVSNIAYSMSQDVVKHWFDTFLFSWRNPAEFSMVRSGLIATFRLFRAVQDMLIKLPETPALLADDLHFLHTFFNKKALKSVLKVKETKLSLRVVCYWDYMLRILHKKDFRRIFDIYYTFDAYQAIAKTAVVHNLQFPEFAETDSDLVIFEAMHIWHPLITNAVPNSLSLDLETPVCILTGANTSGKTTFLKTCGIVVYLAHLGWPAPASHLRVTFLDRLFTSIHLSDNIALGYSHFYAEVMRIKTISEALYAGESCFVLIDELFRGTNQEDSLHCSRIVIDGFTRKKRSFFLVSTHIADLIKHYEQNACTCFRCFRTHINGDDIENNYQIENGISVERLGQVILKKAGIDLLLKG